MVQVCSSICWAIPQGEVSEGIFWVVGTAGLVGKGEMEGSGVIEGEGERVGPAAGPAAAGLR